MAHFVAYECTFLTIENQMKSKKIQINVGKIGVPELNLYPVHNVRNAWESVFNARVKFTVITDFCYGPTSNDVKFFFRLVMNVVV